MVEPAFDGVIHELNRLRICSALVNVDSLTFRSLREILATTDSALSKHVKLLVEHGYVAVMRVGNSGRYRRSIALTPRGRQAYSDHMAALSKMIAFASLGDTSTVDRSLERFFEKEHHESSN